jgi:hypothetical protein
MGRVDEVKRRLAQRKIVGKTYLKAMSALGWGANAVSFPFVIPDLIRDPWPDLEIDAAPKAAADHGS